MRREKLPKRLDCLGGEFGEFESLGLAGVGEEDRRTAGVRDDAHARARGERLSREQCGDVEHGFQGVGAEDSRLLEEGIDGNVHAGEGGRVARRGPSSGGRSAGLHGDDGFFSHDAGRDSAEFAGISEALEVQKDYVGVRIVGPVFDQVVTGDVGLVAHGNERGNPEIQLAHVVEDGQTERAALRQNPDVSGGGPDGGECHVEPDVSIGIEQAHAVGADGANACGARFGDDPLFGLSALLGGLGKAGGDDDNSARAGGDAIIDDGLDEPGGYGDDDEIDRMADIGE